MSQKLQYILDGGMGHLLKQKVPPVQNLPYEQQFIAGAIANVQHPSTVKQCHEQYIQSGATVITTNNFVATKYYQNLYQDLDYVDIIKAAGQCAREVANASEQQVLVAGSVPPPKESYQVSDLPNVEESAIDYLQIIRTLAPYVDLFLAETISTIQELQSIFKAIQYYNTELDLPSKPMWLSISVEDSKKQVLRSGEPLQLAVQQIQRHQQDQQLQQKSHINPYQLNIQAILINCSAPGAILHALPLLHSIAASGIMVGAYPNAFQVTTSQWMHQQKYKDEESEQHNMYNFEVVQQGFVFDSDGIITKESFIEFCQQCLKLQCSIIGGCCGIGPKHIKELHSYIKSIEL